MRDDRTAHSRDQGELHARIEQSRERARQRLDVLDRELLDILSDFGATPDARTLGRIEERLRGVERELCLIGRAARRHRRLEEQAAV